MSKSKIRISAPRASDTKRILDLFDQGAFESAALLARKLTKSFPRHQFAWNFLGVLLEKIGQLDEALTCKKKNVELSPNSATAHHNLGNSWMKRGYFAEAEASFRRVLALTPKFFEAHRTLGNALKMQGHFEAAEISYRNALAIAPGDGFSQMCLGHLRLVQNRPDEALEHYMNANSLIPDATHLLASIAMALFDQGRLEEALGYLRKALEQEPDNAKLFHQLLFLMLHDPSSAPLKIHSLHLAFGDRFEQPKRASWRPHANGRDPLRRLKVGFVSGDLFDHAVASFIEPIWEALNSNVIEVHAFSNHQVEDKVTLRLRQLATAWHQITALSDKALANLVRSEGIDILIDLSGHTGRNRLLCFAYKPAPVQATWIGYPGTTGLRSMDYLICDRFNAPHGLYENFHTEQFARLPSSVMFSHARQAPAVNDLPALKNGYVTFASFNRRCKLGSAVVQTWSRVLTALPHSRLLLGNIDDETTISALKEQFSSHNVAAERLEFHPKVVMGQYLALHHKVDIVLDAWPYSGGTTTNHALWMGVPVLTMRGSSRANGQSAASIGRTNLEGWVVDNEDDFVRIAVERASDLQALATLRSTLRERWLASPWRDSAVVARGLEAGLRVMWQRWCAGLPAEHFEIEPS